MDRNPGALAVKWIFIPTNSWNLSMKNNWKLDTSPQFSNLEAIFLTFLPFLRNRLRFCGCQEMPRLSKISKTVFLEKRKQKRFEKILMSNLKMVETC